MVRSATAWMGMALVLSLSAASFADSQATIVKNPPRVTTKTFNPKRPPAAMPKLTPPEVAVCEGTFPIDASVNAQARQTGPGEATMTVTSVKIKLDCEITIWVPKGADKRVIEHEQGHCTINEDFYKKAEAVAHAVADSYVGKEIKLTGPDLRGQLNKQLDQISVEITDAYKTKLEVEKTQAEYDKITDHSMKDIPVSDAIAQAFAATNPDIVK